MKTNNTLQKQQRIAMRKTMQIKQQHLVLHNGGGWWGSVLATGHYESKRNDLASDYHDFCNMNSLDRSDVKSAEWFLKEIKMEQKLEQIKDDFR